MLKRKARLSWQRLTLSALAGVAFMPGPAAAAVQGIGISPTSQEISLSPGESRSGEITVINDGDRDVSYKIYASDYHVNDESYVGDFASSAKQADVSPVSWFTLPKGNFVVKSRLQTNFSYTVTAPPTAAVGGHYGAIFIETLPPSGQGGAFISRIERIGSIFYITAKGDLRQTGSIAGLTAPFLQSTSPVQASLRMRNDGNVHFLVDGTAQLSSVFGNVGKPVQIKGEVLPGTTRKFDLLLPSASPIGLYTVTATVKYLGRTEIVSQPLLLMPRVTFIIISATVLLLLILGVLALLRRAKKRRRA
jgi:hypothetical protein